MIIDYRNYMSARWYGFTDPQSRLDYFTWRAGTRPGMADIVRSSHLPLTDILVEPDLNLQLPIGKRVYVTIKAYNKAGNNNLQFVFFLLYNMNINENY